MNKNNLKKIASLMQNGVLKIGVYVSLTEDVYMHDCYKDFVKIHRNKEKINSTYHYALLNENNVHIVEAVHFKKFIKRLEMLDIEGLVNKKVIYSINF